MSRQKKEKRQRQSPLKRRRKVKRRLMSWQFRRSWSKMKNNSKTRFKVTSSLLRMHRLKIWQKVLITFWITSLVTIRGEQRANTTRNACKESKISTIVKFSSVSYQTVKILLIIHQGNWSVIRTASRKFVTWCTINIKQRQIWNKSTWVSIC